MRIAALLGLKDEAELLPHVIDHLYGIGIDLIVARDCGSTDGSAEILRQRQSGRLRLEPLTEEENGDDQLWARRESEVARSTDADWVIFLDADEFWLPATGSLKSCPQLHDPSIDVLRVRRFNVLLGEHGPCMPPRLTPAHYSELQMFVKSYSDLRTQLEQYPDTLWSSGIPMPKMIARPSRIGPVNPGHHGAEGADGGVLSMAPAVDVVIAHLPFSTPERFRRKVENIRELLGRYPGMFPGQGGWHWKRWIKIAEQGALEAEFDRQRVSYVTLERLKATGDVQSAAAVLSNL